MPSSDDFSRHEIPDALVATESHHYEDPADLPSPDFSYLDLDRVIFGS
jgi:hypothetical protein